MSKIKPTKHLSKDHSSPATSYLLSVLESKAKEEKLHSIDAVVSRVSSALSSFDEIIPHCGIYSSILKLIREELCDAVYSDSYTTSSSTSSTSTSLLERIPYFVLYKRLQDQRDESKELLEGQIEEKQQEIEELKSDVLQKDFKIKELSEQAKGFEIEVSYLEKQLDSKEDHINILMKQITEEKVKSEDIVLTYETIVQSEKLKSGDLQAETDYLKRYKVAYDTLKDTFDLPPDKRPRRGFRRPIVSTKKTQLLSNIEAASKLEQQILEVQTKSLEEYDQYLEEVKTQLSQKRFAENEHDSEFFNEELQLENLSDEMSSKLKNFQQLISSAVVELELVRQHRDTLQSQLTQMEQAENLAAGDAGSNAGTLPPSSMAGGPGSSRMMTHDETGKKTSTETLSLESGLEEDTTPLVDPTSDPFNPQERLLSKYSAMIYTSINGGKTFDEISWAKFCASCGEKTAVCPHKITKSDLLVVLPAGCTHIKLARPTVRVSLPSLQAQSSHEQILFGHPGKWYDAPSDSRGWETSDDSSDASPIRRQLTPLLQDAKRRAGIDSMSSSTAWAARDLSLQRVLSLLEQFYASVLWRDEHSGPDDDTTTFKEYMYNFLSERYQEDEISPMATYDLITAIVKYAVKDKIVQVLGLALAGVIDGSVARYVHLVADMIDTVEWKEVSDFRAFSEVLYPFLHEDDVESLVMEYTAFSENKISKTLVMNYIIHITIKNKEPRITDAESRLNGMPMKEKAQMNSDEFLAAMESIAPLAKDALVKRLTYECMFTMGYTVAPTKKLAGVTAYVALLQVFALVKSQVAQKVEEARNQREEVATKLHTSPTLVPEKAPLITMTQIKLLASNIARQRQAGNRPSQHSFEEDFWHSRPNTRDSLL